MKTSALFLLPFSAAFALPSVGPDYAPPETSAPAAYRDAEEFGAWKIAAPSDAFERGEWWKLFNDPVLDELESRALAANQNLRAATARVMQARAAAGLARSAYWPQVAVGASSTRERTSSTTDNVFPNQHTTTYRAPLEASWEIDLFGRVRRLNESARAEADASVALFEALRLSLTADVATNYFTLVALEQELASVRNTVELRRRAVDLIAARVRSGTAADLDLARAETELAVTETEQAALARQRSSMMNALAVLVGEPANSFTIAIAPKPAASPDIPVGLPSDLLERRPDIAAAERALAAANARIGVAKAAFFPAISLTGFAGQASGDIDRLFDSDSRIWSIGPRLYLPIFQGGRNRANLARSRAAYEEAVAEFRQQVLVAFREVQDALTATKLLSEQSAAQARALEAARRTAARAQTRYDAGVVSYLEVIDAQRSVHALERSDAQLAAQRANARVALIKALGGGWHVASSKSNLAAR
jgi:efflux transporter, outer membrane factor (OMF) lipoprotein, NodT family